MAFSVGGEIRTRHRYGGAKILPFPHIHSAIITLSATEGGQTPLPTSMGGGMAGFALVSPLFNVMPVTVMLTLVLAYNLEVTHKEHPDTHTCRKV